MSVRPFLLLLCLVLIVAPTAASPAVKTTPAHLDVFSITPAEAPAGSNGAYLVYGSGFMSGAHAYLEYSSTRIDATDEARFGYYSGIQCTISIPLSADLGSYNLCVVNTGDTSTGYWARKPNAFNVTAPSPGIILVPEGGGTPTDSDEDREYDDVNGNGRPDFADVVLYFNQMGWIAANEPLSAFDYNDNGSIDFADIVWLFNSL